MVIVLKSSNQTMQTNIVLIGMPGAGKTTVGKCLAENIGFCFVDTDSIIEEQLGMKISEIFSTKGEDYFRKIEAAVIQSLRGQNSLVVSTGGGVFQSEINRQNLALIGDTYYLYAPPETIYNRIADESHRPLLTDVDPKQRLKELFEKRHHLFQMAKYTIDTTNLNPYNVVDEILRIRNGKSSGS